MATINAQQFGIWHDGEPVEKFRLENRNGIAADIIGVGASLQSLWVPDKNGQRRDIVLGYDTPEGYRDNEPYLGCTIGRFANRIAHAAFELDGNSYQLSANAGDDHLHGGTIGLSRRLWLTVLEQDSDNKQNAVSFYLDSPEGEDGYPGNLAIRVRYSLDDRNCLSIEYFARSDATTIINPTNHSYFNLNGHDAGNVLDHELHVFASHFTPLDKRLLPTGEIAAVSGPTDLREGLRLGRHIDDPALEHTGGYDHNFVLDGDNTMNLAAVLTSAQSGIRMAVMTSAPALQVYTANSLAVDAGKGGVGYLRHEAVCLETQRFPDAPNQSRFPSARLSAEELFYSKTVFRFDTVGDKEGQAATKP